jgi:hypothetical protein
VANKNKSFRKALSGAGVQRKDKNTINKNVRSKKNLGRLSKIIILFKRECDNHRRKIIGINNFKIFRSIVFVGLSANEKGIKNAKTKRNF